MMNVVPIGHMPLPYPILKSYWMTLDGLGS